MLVTRVPTAEEEAIFAVFNCDRTQYFNFKWTTGDHTPLSIVSESKIYISYYQSYMLKYLADFYLVKIMLSLTFICAM